MSLILLLCIQVKHNESTLLRFSIIYYIGYSIVILIYFILFFAKYSYEKDKNKIKYSMCICVVMSLLIIVC